MSEGTDQRAQGGPPDGASTSGAASNLDVSILRVAWLAILLGLAMEGLLLLLGAGFGESLGLRSVVADLVRNVSWSVFVCVGLAVGTTITKARVPAMGLLGLFSGPLAFEASRVFHKGTLEALGATASGGADLSPLFVALIKGLEYGCLGLAVGWVGARPWGGLVAHVAVGLAVGLIFGGTIVALTLGSTPPPPAADLLSQGLNELLFPVGCAVVLFSAGALGERIANRN